MHVCLYVCLCVCLYVCIYVWCCLSDCLHRGSPLCECWYSMSYLFDVVFSPQNLRATQPTHLFSTTTSIFLSLLNATPGRLNEVVVPLSPTDQNPSARPPDSKCICAIVLVARLAQVAVRGDGLWRHEQADQEERPQSLISRLTDEQECIVYPWVADDTTPSLLVPAVKCKRRGQDVLFSCFPFSHQRSPGGRHLAINRSASRTVSSDGAYNSV